MEEPTNFPPSPANSPSVAPYSSDPAQVDTKATAKPDDKTTKADLDQRVATAVACITALQGKDDTHIPDWVINEAKGVVILHRWSGSILVGGSGGWGLGMKKTASGSFSNPVFYEVAGASVGAQAGASEIDTVAFLMSDKAFKTLIDDKYVWSVNLHAVAGSHSGIASKVSDDIDVILYQKLSGLDVGATLATTKLTFDASSNRIFYGSDLAPEEIFSGSGKIPDSVKSLIAVLSNPAPVLSRSP